MFIEGHCVPGMVLSMSHTLCRKQLHKVGIIISISQMGKLRPQEVT